MMINKIEIINKTHEFSCEFANYTHIFSEKNTQGKTTLIRFIIYGLGYKIPITEGISGEKFIITISMEVGDKPCKLIRKGKFVDVITSDCSKTFSVLYDNNALLTFLFNNNNPNLLSNILGTFYIDQENGWGLFNRGKVIGSLYFNVDQLTYGLLGVDDMLFVKRNNIEKEIKDYKTIIDLYLRQDKFEDYFDQRDPVDDVIRDCQQKIDMLKIELNESKKKKSLIKDIKEQNQKLWHYIDSLQLTINDDGKDIKITKDNIVGFRESVETYDAQLYNENANIYEIESKIKNLSEEIDEYFAVKEVVTNQKTLGARSSYKIDLKQSKVNLELLEHQKNVLQSYIDSSLQDINYVDMMNTQLLKYCEKLGVSDILDQNKMILCKDFKRNTGTKKQKLVLAYRATFLKVISDYLGEKFPIIIDSLNRETDPENMSAIVQFIRNEFSDHQIIISTIANLQGDPKLIEVKDSLLKKRDKSAKIKKFR